jgi:hypothetical protein
VLNAQVDTLLKVAVAYNLVDNDTDGPRRDVVDNACSAVVVLVGHYEQSTSIGDPPPKTSSQQRYVLPRCSAELALMSTMSPTWKAPVRRTTVSTRPQNV